MQMVITKCWLMRHRLLMLTDGKQNDSPTAAEWPNSSLRTTQGEIKLFWSPLVKLMEIQSFACSNSFGGLSTLSRMKPKPLSMIFTALCRGYWWCLWPWTLFFLAPSHSRLYGWRCANMKFLTFLNISCAVPLAGNVSTPFSTCPILVSLWGLGKAPPLPRSLLWYPAFTLLRSGMDTCLCAPVASHAGL